MPPGGLRTCWEVGTVSGGPVGAEEDPDGEGPLVGQLTVLSPPLEEKKIVLFECVFHPLSHSDIYGHVRRRKWAFGLGENKFGGR